MIQKGLASILVPVYNGEKYIIEFLDSIKSQIYRPIQLVIRDDCSADNSYKMCMDWIKYNEDSTFSCMCLRAEQNGGLSHNISIMAEYAQGEYIFLADQDDVWKENRVSYQIEYMDKHPECIISLCDRSIANENMEIKEESNYHYIGYTQEIMDFREVIKHRSAYGANTMAIRNGEYNIFKIPKGIVCHDTFITVMASYYGTINYIFEPLLIYRIHGNNLSGNYSAEFSRNALQCFIKYYKAAERGISSHKNDDLIIEQELYTRFGICLKDYDNCFFRDFETSKIKLAWKRLKKNQKKIGVWYRRDKEKSE